jgi:hypothetical protein
MENQDLNIEDSQSNTVHIVGNFTDDLRKVTILTNRNISTNTFIDMSNNNYVLSEGNYNYTIPVNELSLIRIPPFTKLNITGLSENNTIVEINLKNDSNNSDLSYEKQELHVLLKGMKTIISLEIGLIFRMEHFDGVDVKDTCHYVCSNLNFMNILMIIGVILLAYYLIIEAKNKNK